MKYVRLKKKAGARIFDQYTVKIEDCREVTGLRSMKSADESPEFVNVLENALIAVECFKKYVKDDALGAFFNEVLIKCHDWRKLVDGVVRFFNEGRSTIKM